MRLHITSIVTTDTNNPGKLILLDTKGSFIDTIKSELVLNVPLHHYKVVNLLNYRRLHNIVDFTRSTAGFLVPYTPGHIKYLKTPSNSLVYLAKDIPISLTFKDLGNGLVCTDSSIYNIPAISNTTPEGRKVSRDMDVEIRSSLILLDLLPNLPDIDVLTMSEAMIAVIEYSKTGYVYNRGAHTLKVHTGTLTSNQVRTLKMRMLYNSPENYATDLLTVKGDVITTQVPYPK